MTGAYFMPGNKEKLKFADISKGDGAIVFWTFDKGLPNVLANESDSL